MSKIGDIEGGYEVMYVGDSHEVRRTPGGRFSIYDPMLDKTVMSNIVEYENALEYLHDLEGTSAGEEEIAIEMAKEKGQKGFGELLARQKGRAEPEYGLGDTVPVGKVPQLVYLGGGKDYEVWRSAKGRYTVSKRRGGQPSVDIARGLTEEGVRDILARLPMEAPYQTEMSEMPRADYPAIRKDDLSLSRQLHREEIMEREDW